MHFLLLSVKIVNGTHFYNSYGDEKEKNNQKHPKSK
jgi:hypothetical protein